MESLKNKKILLGVTGSIAAYKSPLLVRELVKAGAHVNVVMTPSATKFVTPLVLENLSKNPVAIEMFHESLQSGGAWHIQLAHWCDLMIIAPCSATTLGKLANGICDSALVTVATALPREIPLLISPAMDSTMWLNPSTQRNVKTLAGDGSIIIPPAEGELASGMTGPGRLPDTDILMKYIIDSFTFFKKDTKSGDKPEEKTIELTMDDKQGDSSVEIIIERKKESDKTYEQAIKEALEKPAEPISDAVDKDKWAAELEFTKMKNTFDDKQDSSFLFTGKKVLITAGPTIEKIDEVRFISNFSSGKMGYALARTAKNMGADVTLISGPTAIPLPEGIISIPVQSAKEMYEAVMKEFPGSDIAVMSAAVADYRPSESYDGKIKKSEAGEKLTIELESTDDILSELGRKKKDTQKLIGFALESANEIENGWKKLQAKNCDMIVVNSANKPRSGFQGDENTITILTRDGSEKSFQPMSKDLCAQAIMNRLAEIIE